MDREDQLTLGIDAQPISLPVRLYSLGLPASTAVTLTQNRVTMLSWSPRLGLRLHAGYVAAPDDILRAIVCFVAPRSSRRDRLAARQLFMRFPVHAYAPSIARRTSRALKVAPDDVPYVARLRREHSHLNTKFFSGLLSEIPIGVSHQMRRRLGELRATRDGRAEAIVISRRHIRRDGWPLALDTLLHEMVHQWQVETGRKLGHDREFRAKARAVGISPKAVADASMLC